MAGTEAAPRKARDLTKERHRRALIEATADAIAEHGLPSVSVSRILERAGLSRGMVNLHFQSKANLLVEVVRHYSDEYVANWQAAMAAAGPRPEDRLRAVVAADFDPSVLNRRMMAVWMAFRGEAQVSPAYMPFIDSRDERLRAAYTQICTELRAEGPYPAVDPDLAAMGFMAVLEGLWNDFHLYPERFSRDEARRVVMHLARAFFPRHFD
ncbi:TetR family transcriptional regulator C-terminal domain-containing protein [Albidovulum sp.]|uniref:TetR family transcriptional regulator C-terminal domain-containing protein n=1 Tax=Albidovulum sp. TaxID=1872424 RepID=UPI0039B93930